MQVFKVNIVGSFYGTFEN